MKLVYLVMEALIKDASRAGKCFELSAQECMKNGGTYTIAKVNSNGKTFLHAYVDRGNKIYDPEYDTEFNKSDYEAALHPKVLKSMDKTEVSIFLLKNKSFPYPEKLGLSS